MNTIHIRRPLEAVFQEFAVLGADLRWIVPSFLRRLEHTLAAVENFRKSWGPPWQVEEHRAPLDDVELNLDQRSALAFRL